MSDLLSYDNVISLSKSQEKAIARDEEAYREFRVFLEADRRLYRHGRTYCIVMRYIDGDSREYYNNIKNELMSYVDGYDPDIHVRYELREDAEYFYLANVIAQLRAEAGALRFYIKLDPRKYGTRDAIHKDVGSDPRFTETPMMLKINKASRANKAVSLIRDFMKQNGCIKDSEYIDIDYASFFTRDTLYVTRKIKEDESGEEVEQAVAIDSADDLRSDDVIFLGLAPTLAAQDDQEEATESSDDNANVLLVEGEKEEESSVEETSDESEETAIIGAFDAPENEGDTEEESLTELESEIDETEVAEPKEESNEVEEAEEPEKEEQEEFTEEDHVYVNVASADERPTFRNISGIKHVPLDPNTGERKSIFETTPSIKEESKKRKQTIWQELASYGYDFILLHQLKFYAIAIAIAVGLGLVYKLTWPFILVVVAVTLLWLPGVLSAYYRNKYEEKRFRDAESYIEQMLYSFRRNSKILVSLSDALVVFPHGYMHDKIVEAMDSIRSAKGSGNVYEHALKIIEDAYPCRRIKSLHRYMIKVEGIGGKHAAGINALLKDRRQWVDRTAMFRKQCSATIKEIVISCVFSLIMACLILYMMPSDLYDLSSSIVYQIATTIFIVGNLFVFRTTFKSTVVYLQDEDEESAKKTLRLLSWIRNYDNKAEFKKSCLHGLIFVAVMLIGLFMGKALIMIIGAVLAFFTVFVKRKLDLGSAKKKVKREIEKVYPDWLLELALLLQTDNMHVAIEKTLDTAPLVLRYDLQKLSNDILSHPVDLAPYASFFDFLPMEHVQSSMKLLYSISEFGAVDESVQLSELVERNHTLMEQAERYRNEDRLTKVFAIKFMPMLLSSVKMLVDMMLFLFSYISLIGTMF